MLDKSHLKTNFTLMNQSDGNALFLILIAVALFAALSYAVTQAGRSGGGIDKETDMLKTAQIVQYAGLVQSTVQKMLLFGCAEDEISFLHDTNNDGSVLTDGSDEYYNPNTVSSACLVFDQAGGGLTPQDVPQDVLADPSGEYYFTAASEYQGHATSDADLVLIADQLTEAACASINENVGITGIPTENPPNEVYFEGTYGGSSRIVGNTAPELVGEPLGCYLNTEDTWYTFYHVLHAR